MVVMEEEEEERREREKEEIRRVKHCSRPRQAGQTGRQAGREAGRPGASFLPLGPLHCY
jgi:hypothetical protein